ncbi:methyltransferase domain-containing protein [Runella sp.]|uniref:methyltransferase domain-containing protein n=1 Tax=Runella sp. TaxID=1960881 RepID=UPI003D10D176
MSDLLDKDYWDERYRASQTGWDIGYVSTPLKEYIDQLTNKQARILIPGGGNSHEAAYLLVQGFSDVTVVDISSEVTATLQEKYASRGLKAMCGDFFNHSGQYDLILEQTFFCALDPSLRSLYVQKMNELLVSNGKLAGLLFNRPFEGGPPFGGSVEEYKGLFDNYFELRRMDEAYNSIPRRQGSEVFFIALPKGK